MRLKLALLFIVFTFGATAFAQTKFPFDNEIRDFKHQDSLHFPKPNGILFIGSSSIRKWTDLEQRFPNENIVRRGVGGCELSQVVKYYTPYILFPYHPRKIFIYAVVLEIRCMFLCHGFDDRGLCIRTGCQKHCCAKGH